MDGRIRRRHRIPALILTCLAMLVGLSLINPTRHSTVVRVTWIVAPPKTVPSTALPVSVTPIFVEPL